VTFGNTQLTAEPPKASVLLTDGKDAFPDFHTAVLAVFLQCLHKNPKRDRCLKRGTALTYDDDPPIGGRFGPQQLKESKNGVIVNVVALKIETRSIPPL